MPSLGRMCYLTTVVGSFHGRVLAARLGAEGVIVVLKGAAEGPYPIQGSVDVLVPADQLALAREILLADAVDDVLEGVALDVAAPEEGDSPEGGSEGAALPLPSGDPSDSFSLRPKRAAADGSGGRIHGLPAFLVVVLVVLIVLASVASLVH